MTANEMVKELVNLYGLSKYACAKQAGLSETIIRQLYSGERGRYVRIETVEKVRELYVKMTGKAVQTANSYAFNNMEEFLLASAKLAKPEIEASYRKGVAFGTRTERARCLEICDCLDLASIIYQIHKGKRLKKAAKAKGEK